MSVEEVERKKPRAVERRGRGTQEASPVNEKKVVQSRNGGNKPAQLTPLGPGEWSVRLRCGDGPRLRYRVRAASEDSARKVVQMMQSAAALLVERPADALEIMRAIGEVGDLEQARDCLAVAERQAKRKAPEPKPPSAAMTVRALAERWTSGALHRDYPDQVKAKRSADDDASRFERYIFPVIGDKLVVDVTLDDCEAVMRRLPGKLRPATRRNVARTLGRLLKMAVYPLRLIERTPIPEGFTPKLGPRRAKQALYPSEVSRLMAATSVPLCYRMFWGWCATEGVREGEAMRLTWADFDLTRGAVRLDRNKTDDARSWAIDPGVAAALRAWRELRSTEDQGERVFVDESGRPLINYTLVKLLLRHLRVVGLHEERPELFVTTKERQRMRVHDLRGTFVTVKLAIGKTESWVADRTGHKSSDMINEYKRQARTFAELGLGDFEPMGWAVPECAAIAVDMVVVGLRALQGGPRGGPRKEPDRRPSMISAPPIRFERTTHGLGKLGLDAPSDATAENKPVREPDGARKDTLAHPNGTGGPRPDAVEVALAAAIDRATDDDTIRELLAELKMRRLARAQVVDLDAERAKRGGK